MAPSIDSPTETRAPTEEDPIPRASDGTEEDHDGEEAGNDQPLPYALKASDGTEEDPDAEGASSDQPLSYGRTS